MRGAPGAGIVGVPASSSRIRGSTASTINPLGGRSSFDGVSRFNAAFTVFFEHPSLVVITLIGIPSRRCNRRISAQSSTLFTLHTIPEGASFGRRQWVSFHPSPTRSAQGGRGASAARVGAGERQAEADRGRAGPGHLDVEGPEPGKLLSPTRRRDAVAHLERKFEVSERRACRLVGQHRSTNRYAAAPVDVERRLVARMTKLAERHPRWGYRMVHALLVEEGWPVNRKRIERLWRQEGLQAPPSRLKASGQRAIGEDANSAWMLPAVRPNHVWSYDFVAARAVDGGSLRILNVIDENTRVALGSHVARSIGALEVTRHLERLFAQHGKPALIRADNGREFIANTVQEWLAEQRVRPVQVAKASPQQNCYIERFNGSMRRELLNAEQFHSVLEAKVVIEDWLVLYNTRRAHRGLGGRTPAAYAKMARSQQADNRAGGGG